MALVSQFPTCSSPFSAFHFSLKLHHNPRWGWGGGPSQAPHPLSSTKYFSFSSSNNTSRESVKVRARKSVKSNEELCTELREFVALAGLPHAHAPSVNQLLQHGRKDLANLVRRRGYKLIKELLLTSISRDTNEEMISSEREGTSSENEVDQKMKVSAEGLYSSSGSSKTENSLTNQNGFPAHISSTQVHESTESSTNLSFQEKAAKFVQDGELDTIENEDNASEDDYVISSVNGINVGEKSGELYTDREIGPEIVSKQSSKYEAPVNNATSIEDATMSTSELGAPIATDVDMDDIFSTEGFDGAHFYGGSDVESSRKENQDEVLKVMLHQKKLELSQLKERVEKEKRALSAIQAKSENEIDKAQKVLLEKDEELQAVEESLSGLKEVQIDYWGNGNIVEVAGSFNGWHHRIKMDDHPSSSVISSTDSRKSRLWSTVLWLYPGVYEIKFIVDGHWRTDPQRELVGRGSIENNILRVDR